MPVNNMKIKVKLSGSLRGIYREMDSEILVLIDEPTSMQELLVKLGINPLVVAAILVDGNVRSKDFLVAKDTNEIILVGPIAGG